MCDRSRGRSGCTRHRMTVRANGSFHVWISGASGCRLPRDVFPEPRVSCAPARSLVPGSPWRSCTYQHALPRDVAATPFSTMLATRHSMRCHARTPHSQKLTQRSSAHPTPAAPDPHSPNREQGTGEPPWQSCTERPHLPRGVAQPPLPHMIATKARAGQCPTPLAGSSRQGIPTTPGHPPPHQSIHHHVWTSTTPRHPWSSCAGRSPVPRAVVWDPVQPRIATAAELSHCPRLSSWRGP